MPTRHPEGMSVQQILKIRGSKPKRVERGEQHSESMPTQGHHAGTWAWPRWMEEVAGRQRKMSGRVNPTHRREPMDLR